MIDILRKLKTPHVVKVGTIVKMKDSNNSYKINTITEREVGYTSLSTGRSASIDRAWANNFFFNPKEYEIVE